MGGSRIIFDEKDLSTYSADMIKNIDRAVLAAAYRLRDNMRQAFVNGSSLYKYGTPKYKELAKGIEVGKIRDSKVKVHAMGTRAYYDSYKTRFFVGGTVPRTQIKQGGKRIKPYTKGYIKENDAIEKGLSGGEQLLNTFINNVIQN